MTGAATGDGAGFSVSLSADGSVLALGVAYEATRIGYARIFSYARATGRKAGPPHGYEAGEADGGWAQLGGDIMGEAMGDACGTSLVPGDTCL